MKNNTGEKERSKTTILTQILGVSHRRTPNGKEGLIYAPVPAPMGLDMGIPPSTYVPVKWEALHSQIEQIRSKIETLTFLALQNKKRGSVEIEQEARSLEKLVLPENGFTSIIHQGMHPQFDIIQDAAELIPWEVMEEYHFICDNPAHKKRSFPCSKEASSQRFCDICGREMTIEGGKLCINYHLSHLIRGCEWSSMAGNEFLCIEDPSNDLCSDIKDPDKISSNHLKELRKILSSFGYKINLLSRKNATRNRVLKAISNPELAGIYYFGHGYFPKEGDEGCLILADGHLYTSDIKNIDIKAKLVFINACEGAASGRNWDLEKSSSSVASAFAKAGCGKVVIAPLWPMLNIHASEAALDFFKSASQNQSFGASLQQVRRSSLQRYHAGEPHTTWMAYRYYGDPNKALPIPGDVPVEICRGSLSAVKCRVFDGESKINKEIFAFGIDDVLLRAAKRKNLQSRTLVSTTDFIAGFLRKGTLTRTLLKEINLDPDQLYTKLEEHVEQESGTDSLPDASQRMDTLLSFELDNEDEEAIQKHVDNWIISRKNQCTSDLIDIFLKADELSQQQDSSEKESPISEANVLECLIYNPLWKNLAIVGLPSEEEIGHLILKHKIQGKIDENGELILAKLDDNAKKIIKAAHNLSQQRGVFPIPNRVLFASFLIDEKGYLNRICNQKQIDVAALFEFLMGVIEDNSPLSFGLSVEACERIVLPVIEKATELAHDKIISEKILFRAFCECANSEFKSFVKTFFPEIDLDNIESTQIPGQQEEEPTEAPLSLVSKDNANQSEMPKQDQFDSTAWNIIMESAKCAFSQGWNEIKSPHLFAALITSRSEPIETLLRINAIKAEDLKSLVLSIVPARPSIPGSISTVTFSRNTFKIIRQAVDIARSVGHPKVGVQELFAAFFADGGGIVGELFNHLGIRTDENNPTSSQQIFNPRNPSLLSMFGVDLTEKAKQGLLSEIVGREDEIQTALQTLLLTENANPLLVGEAGVGKTAIVEGIAQRIVQKRCPKNLQSKRIIELSAGGLVANTSLRGEFEQRIQGILAEAKDDVILFIDEIHTLVGAGSGDGRGPDAANMLKAALARGSLRLIGATTYAEYKKTIARDKALSRRFQVQIIGPTSRNATVQILSSRKKIFEKHHGVEISVDTIEAATDLSGRYIVDKHWPAKARDVLERACVLALVESETKKSGDTILVSKEHVVKVIANSTGIPIERLTIDEQQTLAALEQRINRRIIGQPQAIHTLVESIRKGRQGLASLNKPWGAFLCVGPPGVGKTELAKILAEEIFGGTDALIRFDMGDFTEAHSTAKLIGAPPGYIGFDQGSPLIDKLRMHPYSVILFDEIEHAHENVLAVLLRLLSEGTISDNEGNIADARNTIVIMTSNKLSQESQSLKIGFVTDTVDKQNKPALTNIRTLMAQHFPPKFIDRLDGIIEFKQLTAEDLLTITTLRVQDVVEKVYDMYNLSLTIEPNVTKWILEKALNEDCGARSIQRTIDNTLIAEIMRFLGSEIGKKIDISIVDNSIKAKLVEP